MAHFNLASERTRIGMTQSQLAKKLGCSLSSVGKWEKNISKMPSTMLDKATTMFGCSADYLLDKTDDRLMRTTPLPSDAQSSD